MNKLFHKFLRIPKVIKGKDFFVNIQSKQDTLTFGNPGASWTFIPSLLDSKSIVYSFGVGEDISFDLLLINKFNLKINAFDPTPKSINWIKNQKISPNFKLHEFGLSNKDGEVAFFPPTNPNFVSATIINRPETKSEAYNVPVKKLDTIFNDFNHSQIDILKMDIEGAEYDVIDDILNSKIPIKQLLIEFHHRFKNVGVNKTKEAIKKLNNAGFLIFDISNSGEEYSFISQV